MAFRICRAALCLALFAVVAPAARADFIDLWADKLDMPLNKGPRVGHSRVLLIPVQIDYTGAAGPFAPIDMDRLQHFFTDPASPGALSFNGFFQIASNGKYAAQVTVAPLVRYNGCPAMLAASADCSIARGDLGALTAGMDFVRDVFRRAHEEGKVDLSLFDVNGLGGQPDGVIDGAMIVVNIPGVGIAFPIEYVNSGSNLNGGTGGPLIIDGIKVPYVAVGGQSTVQGLPRFELVVLHEFGHVLGLADLYYEHPMMGDPYPNWQGLHFSLMGDYAYDEKATLPDAESRRALGWQDVHVISGTQTVTLPPAAAGGGMVKLGMMDGNRKEFFLAEVRGPAGAYDVVQDGTGKPMWGLAVYHVDWSRGPKPEQGAWTQRLLSCLDCDPFHPFIRNLESSNQWGLVFSGPSRSTPTGSTGFSDDGVLFTAGGLSALSSPGVLSRTNRYTATNFYDGTDSGVRIENVIVNADHSVTATFTAPFVPDPCADVHCAPLEQCVASGPRAGNCDPMVVPQVDGGVIDAGHSAPPVPVEVRSGCSTGAGATSAMLLPLVLIGAALARRRALRG